MKNRWKGREGERGFSLVETVIAIALLGIVAVAFLGALSTASRSIFIADERATAESLARTEMEYVRNQDYTTAPQAYEKVYDGYTVKVSVKPLHKTDDGIQKITVVVYHPYDAAHPEDYVVKLEGYRSQR